MSVALKNVIASVVTLVWAAIALSTVYTKNYVALGSVTPVMMLVTGFLFGYKVEVHRNGDGKEDDMQRPRPSDLSDW